MITNDTDFEYMGSVGIEPSTYNHSVPIIIQNLEQFDANVYQNVLNYNNASFDDKEILYGQLFLQKIEDQYGDLDLQIACILNSTSRAAVGSWGSFAHEAMMRKYLVDTLFVQSSEITP